jgi:hypothetical protein
MKRSVAVTLVGALIVTLIPVRAFSEEKTENGLPLKLSAWAVSMGTMATGKNSVIKFKIERWSTDEERSKLITTFKEKGPEKLLDVLQDMKRVGFMRLPQTVGYDLQYAREFPMEDGGRRIIMATDRRVSQMEAMSNPHVSDYPFTLIEIHLDKDGKGVGVLSLATKIGLNKEGTSVEIENFSTEPVELKNVKIDD